MDLAREVARERETPKDERPCRCLLLLLLCSRLRLLRENCLSFDGCCCFCCCCEERPCFCLVLRSSARGISGLFCLVVLLLRRSHLVLVTRPRFEMVTIDGMVEVVSFSLSLSHCPSSTTESWFRSLLLQASPCLQQQKKKRLKYHDKRPIAKTERAVTNKIVAMVAIGIESGVPFLERVSLLFVLVVFIVVGRIDRSIDATQSNVIQ